MILPLDYSCDPIAVVQPKFSEVVVVVGYLTTFMYYSYIQRPSPYVNGLYMVWIICGGHMITGDECSLNFLTFILRLSKMPGKTSTRKLTRPVIELGPAGSETMTRRYPTPERWCRGGTCLSTPFWNVL